MRRSRHLLPMAILVIALIAAGTVAGAQNAKAPKAAKARVISLSVVAEDKKGPEGEKHDDFTVTDFHVQAGEPVTLRINNTDTVPHSITSPEAGVRIVALPGLHSYRLLVNNPGKFEWYCEFTCDPWSMQHAGYMRGFITAT